MSSKELQWHLQPVLTDEPPARAQAYSLEEAAAAPHGVGALGTPARPAAPLPRCALLQAAGGARFPLRQAQLLLPAGTARWEALAAPWVRNTVAWPSSAPTPAQWVLEH